MVDVTERLPNGKVRHFYQQPHFLVESDIANVKEIGSIAPDDV